MSSLTFRWNLRRELKAELNRKQIDIYLHFRFLPPQNNMNNFFVIVLKKMQQKRGLRFRFIAATINLQRDALLFVKAPSTRPLCNDEPWKYIFGTCYFHMTWKAFLSSTTDVTTTKTQCSKTHYDDTTCRNTALRLDNVVIL